MMFYALAIIGILACIWMVDALMDLRRHDMVLYRFCDLRRTAMAMLRDESMIDAMGKREYMAFRQMIDLINMTISSYKEHRTVMFDLRRFLLALQEYKRLNTCTELIEKTGHKEIEALRADLQHALIFGFITYTPFIRVEFIVRGVAFLLQQLSRMGWAILSSYAGSLREAVEISHKGRLHA